MKTKRTFRQRLANVLLGVDLTDYERRVTEAYYSGLSDGNDDPVSGTTASYAYRVAGKGLRDLSSLSRKEVLGVVWKQFQASPVAKRVIEIKRGYIMGSGLDPSCGDEAINQVVNDFWSYNKLDKNRAREFCAQLFLFGDQTYPAYVRQSDGRVTLGYIDPEQIERVIKHPANSMEDWAVVVQGGASADNWQTPYDKLVYRIIRRAEVVSYETEDGATVIEPSEDTQGRLVTAEQAIIEPWEKKMLAHYGLNEYDGSCFFTKVNAVSNQSGGVSDLLQVLDWIDQADAVLFALGEREQMADYFAYEVIMRGASKKVIDERAKELRLSPPAKGSVNLHNDAEEWVLHTANLQQVGHIEAFNALLTFILGGMGFPRHWYGYGDETNRATAEAQGDPTWRTLQDCQSIVVDMFLSMCEFARDQAIISGYVSTSEETDEQIDMPAPEMSTKDMGRTAQAMSQVAGALIAARDAGWITLETAAQAWANIMSELGVEINPTTELEIIAQQEYEKVLADEDQRNRQIVQQLGLSPLPPDETEGKVRLRIPAGL